MACGVSLRTIQRVEADGQASSATVQALASVFELEYRQLIDRQDSELDYHNMQLGTVLIAIFIAVALLTAWSLYTQRMPAEVFVALNIVTVALCTLFSTMTTKVNATEIEWHFSFGFWRKKVALKDVHSYSVVRNKPWWGLGIRFIPNGMLYNVSGLDAIELVMQNKRRIRIGSDQAEEFRLAIERAKCASGQ